MFGLFHRKKKPTEDKGVKPAPKEEKLSLNPEDLCKRSKQGDPDVRYPFSGLIENRGSLLYVLDSNGKP